MFDCLYKPHILTQVTIVSLHRHKLDNAHLPYRFSHTALRILLEDRGFEVLDVGYDICTQPENMLKNKKDEHFEKIWLTYVVGRKL